ncbi:hypothetical protein IWQ56_005990 [Coemansia nantahalensis]|nr:hypothetical protein IWQ56_005990 [Coemansia nantahalensis]
MPPLGPTPIPNAHGWNQGGAWYNGMMGGNQVGIVPTPTVPNFAVTQTIHSVSYMPVTITTEIPNPLNVVNFVSVAQMKGVVGVGGAQFVDVPQPTTAIVVDNGAGVVSKPPVVNAMVLPTPTARIVVVESDQEESSSSSSSAAGPVPQRKILTNIPKPAAAVPT